MKYWFLNQTAIKSLNNRHFAILNRCLAGKTNKEICAEFSMQPTQVSIIVNSSNFQHELALQRDKVIEKSTSSIASMKDETEFILKNNTIKAAQRIADLIDSDNESTSRQSANDLLDRAGFPKVLKQEQKNIAAVVVLDAADLTRLRETIYMDADWEPELKTRYIFSPPQQRAGVQ